MSGAPKRSRLQGIHRRLRALSDEELGRILLDRLEPPVWRMYMMRPRRKDELPFAYLELWPAYRHARRGAFSEAGKALREWVLKEEPRSRSALATHSLIARASRRKELAWRLAVEIWESWPGKRKPKIRTLSAHVTRRLNADFKSGAPPFKEGTVRDYLNELGLGK